MKATINFESKPKYIDLFLAFKAISTYPEKSRLVLEEEGVGEIIFQPIVNSVIYKPSNKDYYFLTENISTGEAHDLVHDFVCGLSDKLEEYNWLGKYKRRENHNDGNSV